MTGSLIKILKLNGQGIISIIGAGGKTSLMFRLAKELAESGKKVLTTTTTKIFLPRPDQSPDIIITDFVDELIEKSKSCLDRFNHFSAGREQIQTPGTVNRKLKGFDPATIDQLWEAACFDWIIVEADGAKRKSLKSTDTHEPLLPGMTTHLIHVTGLDVVGKTLDDNHVHRAELFSNNTGLLLGESIDEQSIAASAAFEIEKAEAAISAAFLSVLFLNKADNIGKVRQGEKIAELINARNVVDKIIIASLMDKKFIQYCFDIQSKETKEIK
ncbi:MAG: putative selenium-dependent hydroxylase accessory protein YqeC [Desulfobacteraceae bacterium]|nr:putative selenium-dependent hydroxylase accessory protein YqeC [Desulfobacteraceae bacterium]